MYLKKLNISQEEIRIMLLEMCLDISIPLLDESELILLKEMTETNIRYRYVHYKLASKILNVSIDELLSETDLMNLITNFNSLDNELQSRLKNIVYLFYSVVNLKELKLNYDKIEKLLNK